MATSFDYFEALINKEKFIKSLYEDELIKMKATNEVSKLNSCLTYSIVSFFFPGVVEEGLEYNEPIRE
jgi:hypothetical protein